MQAESEPGQGGRRRLNKALISGLALLGVGAVAGTVAATAVSAGAATTTTTVSGNTGSGGASTSTTSPSTTNPNTTSPSTSTAPGSGTQGSGPPPGAPTTLPLHGTITAMGTSSVTIKTSSGTTTYPVTSSSDLEKNGSTTTLSGLAVGDDVGFSTVTSDGTTAIDELVAGTWPEAACTVRVRAPPRAPGRERPRQRQAAPPGRPARPPPAVRAARGLRPDPACARALCGRAPVRRTQHQSPACDDDRPNQRRGSDGRARRS